MRSFFKRYIGALFIPARFFVCGMICFTFFMLAFYQPFFYALALVMVYVFVMLVLADYTMLFTSVKLIVKRQVHSRLSNGDDNEVALHIRNLSPFRIFAVIIDELPEQLQERDFKIEAVFQRKEKRRLKYVVRPLVRGIYRFGDIQIFACSVLGLLRRRITIEAAEDVQVYPSFIQLRNFQLTARTTSQQHGSTRVRRIGNSFEFEQVKEYVTGDDIRKINWKATARRASMMVNHYADEKSQQVYIVIDKGRLMKMPFKGLSLLDYAINSALVLTNVCLQKQDRVGLISFSEKMGDIIPADKKLMQREVIMQSLFSQQTTFLESDFEMLYLQIRSKIRQRSLLILFTNFESVTGLQRQLPYLKSIAEHHLLLIIFFENTELRKLTTADAHSIEDIYVKTIAGKFSFEKRLIVKELQQLGILGVLTAPEDLTVTAINKYLELKSRRMI